MNNLLVLAAFLIQAVLSAHAADMSWTNGTASYNNALFWSPNTIPGASDNAINDHGLGNLVRINVGDPDWTVGQIRAGNSAGNGAFEQNGQNVTVLGTNYNGPVITEFFTPFRLGIVAADTGVYTLNGGTLNYGTGPFHVGEVGTGTLNINGGTITGTGLFSVNSGGIAVPNPAVITATAGHGPYLGDMTYFEQGYYAPDTTKGIPAAGTTVNNPALDHSYTLAPSYTAPNAVVLDAAVNSATITLTTPTVCSALSFLCSAGNGPVTNTYTVHYASGADDTGTLIVEDWFFPQTLQPEKEVLDGNGRVDGLGVNFQITTPVSGYAGNPPYLWSLDTASLVNPDKVVSIQLTFAGGGGQYSTATFMGVSGQTTPGSAFVPLAVSGYNADVVVEAGAPSPYVSASVMDTVTQTGGTNTINQLWVAQGKTAHGTYNLSNGEIDVNDWTVIGRAGGIGTFNMTGGTINKANGGNFIIGSGAGDNTTTGYGTFNQSGGTINNANEYWLGENALTSGTNNISGTAVLNLNNWLSIGRGGLGVINFSGGVINKNSNGAFIIGDGGTAYFSQTGGTINSDGELWIGQSGSAVGQYDLRAGAVTANNWISIGRNGGNGTLNLSGGSITKGNNGNLSIGGDGGATGNLNQSGGTITNLNTMTWLGQGGGNGTWTMDSGSATLGTLQFCEAGNGSGVLNLNGGVISASEVNCGVDGANGTFYFNGGTLQAAGNNANFFHGLVGAYIQAGGATIDSQGFNVTVSQSLTDNGGGGLTKIGSGSLTLSGANSYTGPTVVNGGSLFIGTDTAASGDYSVASGAQLSLSVLAPNAQLNVANLTLASSTPALGFDLGAFGNPTLAPLNVFGALVVNGTVAINIADALPQPGQFPLIKYGSKTGAGSFVVGSLPVGVVASIVNNTANNSIDLNITSVNLPRWDGQAGGTWDIGLTTNWVNLGDGLPTFYGQGNAVLFNDSALGLTTVNITTTVNPSRVTINNSSLTYTFNGSGKISGNAGVTKEGSGVATMANTGGNDYSGPTVISGGVLSVNSLANGGAPSSIGASSANPTNLVLANGALQYSGPPTAINRGYTIQDTNSAIDAQGDLTLSGLATAAPASSFVKLGPARLAYTTVGSNLLSSSASPGYIVQEGTVVFDGSGGGQTNLIQGDRLGLDGPTGATVILSNTTVTTSGNLDLGNIADTTGTLVVNSNATLNVGSWFIFGDGGNSGGTATLNGGTLNVNNGTFLMGGRPGAMSTLNLNGGVFNKAGGTIIVAPGNWNGDGARTGIVNQVDGTFTFGDEIQIGQAAQGTGFYNLHGGVINSTGWFVIGRAGGNGTMTIDGGTLNHTSAGQPAFIVGSGAGDNNAASVGVLNQSGGIINCNSEYWVGENTASVGTNNISGTAVVNIGNWVSLGRGGQATVNFSGGTITKTGGGNFIIGDNGNALFTQTGGALSINNEFWIGQSGGGVGEYDLSAGTVTGNSWVAVGRAGATGVLNISGGSLTKLGDNGSHITVGSGGPGTVNQTGGTITSTLSSTFIGEGGQPGIWNMNGGSAVLSTVFLPINNGANGTLNLNAGTFSSTEITSGNPGGTGALNFNGGTLIAGSGASLAFLHDLTTATVLGGGATIDSGANVVNVDQALLDGFGGGGLTKLGTGTLNLNGANTYTGPTVVNAGTLGGSGSISGPLTVAAGGALAPGTSIGTFTVNNSVTLGGTIVMEISKDGGLPASDRLAVSGNLALGGTLTVLLSGTNALAINDTFNLLDWGARSGSFAAVNLPVGYSWDTSQLNVDGTIRVMAVSPPILNQPTTAAGKLVLTGIGGPAGASYSWLSSTNVAAPVANWTTNITGIFDANGAFSNAFPINTSEPARFFRMKTP